MTPKEISDYLETLNVPDILGEQLHLMDDIYDLILTALQKVLQITDVYNDGKMYDAASLMISKVADQMETIERRISLIENKEFRMKLEAVVEKLHKEEKLKDLQ